MRVGGDCCSYFRPAAGPSGMEEEEQGGEWAFRGPVEGVRGGDGLPPILPN